MVMAQSTLGVPVGSGRICRGAGRAYVDGRFCAPVDLFDVHARYLSALHQARQQRGASHARGQSILMAGRCAHSGSCDRHGKNARAPAGELKFEVLIQVVPCFFLWIMLEETVWPGGLGRHGGRTVGCALFDIERQSTPVWIPRGGLGALCQCGRLLVGDAAGR